MCPRLTTFSVAGVDGSDLKDLVQTRKEKGYPLTEMFVDKEAFMDKEDMKWLRENLEVLDFFEGSEDGFDEGSVMEVDLDDEDDLDDFEYEGGVFDHDNPWDDEDGDDDHVESEEEGDSDEWTDED